MSHIVRVEFAEPQRHRECNVVTEIHEAGAVIEALNGTVREAVWREWGASSKLRPVIIEGQERPPRPAMKITRVG